MPSGLAALLDDVAALTRLAAVSIDDVGAAAAKAGTKAAGVVVDDAAVTPQYVTDFTPDRELPVIWRIAKGSLFNKFVILLPIGLLLSAFLPWAITPILMAGGAFLCFEGAEKIIHKLSHQQDTAEVVEQVQDMFALENERVKGAVRTDLILSAEIMAIALSEVADRPIAIQAAVLAVVGLLITVAVYGAVGLIVKMDDFGLHLARKPSAALQGFGRGLVKAMPIVMSALGIIGTAAMVWVGGQIIVHGLAVFGVAGPEHLIHDIAVAAGQAVPAIGGLVEWLVGAIGAGIIGLILGGIIAAIYKAVKGKATH
jgi:predicted DNA repair protein MutK